MGRALALIEVEIHTDWLDILVAAAPLLVALFGIWINGRLSAKRWRDERALEARKWAVEQRRDAYANLHAAAAAWLISAGELIAYRDRGVETTDEQRQEHRQAFLAYGRALDVVRLVGSTEFNAAADALHERVNQVKPVVLHGWAPGADRDVLALMPDTELEALIRQARSEVAEL